jgi:uncharacterized protein (TIGR03435 family)
MINDGREPIVYRGVVLHPVTALEELLGLKLKPAIAPLDALVIDSAEKPSEN